MIEKKIERMNEWIWLIMLSIKDWKSFTTMNTSSSVVAKNVARYRSGDDFMLDYHKIIM